MWAKTSASSSPVPFNPQNPRADPRLPYCQKANWVMNGRGAREDRKPPARWAVFHEKIPRHVCPALEDNLVGWAKINKQQRAACQVRHHVETIYAEILGTTLLFLSSYYAWTVTGSRFSMKETDTPATLGFDLWVLRSIKLYLFIADTSIRPHLPPIYDQVLSLDLVYTLVNAEEDHEMWLKVS